MSGDELYHVSRLHPLTVTPSLRSIDKSDPILSTFTSRVAGNENIYTLIIPGNLYTLIIHCMAIRSPPT